MMAGDRPLAHHPEQPADEAAQVNHLKDVAIFIGVLAAPFIIGALLERMDKVMSSSVETAIKMDLTPKPETILGKLAGAIGNVFGKPATITASTTVTNTFGNLASAGFKGVYDGLGGLFSGKAIESSEILLRPVVTLANGMQMTIPITAEALFEAMQKAGIAVADNISLESLTKAGEAVANMSLQTPVGALSVGTNVELFQKAMEAAVQGIVANYTQQIGEAVGNAAVNVGTTALTHAAEQTVKVGVEKASESLISRAMKTFGYKP